MYTDTHSNCICNSSKLQQPKGPPTGEWINTLWCIHTTEHYNTIKRSELLIHTMIRVTLKIITLSEGSQTEKDDSTYLKVWTANEATVTEGRSISGCQEGMGWGVGRREYEDLYVGHYDTW